MPFPPLVIDLSFSHAVQQFQPGWLTICMKGISNVIDPLGLFIFGLLAVIYLHFRKHDERTIISIFLLTVGNFLTPLLKVIFVRPRPTLDLVHILTHESGYSFPSGHAVAVVILGGIIAVLIQRLTRHHQRLWLTGVVLLIVLVCYSRIYLGVHWLSDVLFGCLVGLAWVALILRLYPIRGNQPIRT